jgi:transposase InsO family protein
VAFSSRTSCCGHPTRKGDRLLTLEPVAQGTLAQRGHVGQDAVRGLSLRMDHGTQYFSDYVENQVKFRGIAPSFAFQVQPQTNGKIERWHKSLKVECIRPGTLLSLDDGRRLGGRLRPALQRGTASQRHRIRDAQRQA